MEAMVKKYILPDSIGAPWARKMALSLIAPLCILALRPLGLTLRQSGVLAAVVLTIIWWSADIVKKIPASFFLLAVFWAVSGAGFRKVFSFIFRKLLPVILPTNAFQPDKVSILVFFHVAAFKGSLFGVGGLVCKGKRARES